jgi:hypothetical protein
VTRLPSGDFEEQARRVRLLIGQAFAYQDERRGDARLGMPYDSAAYDLEAR